MSFAGAEANVAASISMLGGDASFVTALPNNELSDACIAALQATGMASHIIRTEYGRLGLSFLETGANQRPSRVLYDRDHSAITLTDPAAYDWPGIFSGASWFHTTGITPAISGAAAQATIDAVTAAKDAGLTVSCDLSFRDRLWQWDETASNRELAGRVMRDVLPFVDVLIASEEDCHNVLGIGESASHSEPLCVERYPDVARLIVSEFPSIQMVATTLRQGPSATHNRWGAMLYDAGSDEAEFSPQVSGQYQPYEISHIIDREGASDAFAAGLIFAITCDDYVSPADALNFAAAASCLAHSVPGDFNYATRTEVDALAACGVSAGDVSYRTDR